MSGEVAALILRIVEREVAPLRGRIRALETRCEALERQAKKQRNVRERTTGAAS